MKLPDKTDHDFMNIKTVEAPSKSNTNLWLILIIFFLIVMQYMQYRYNIILLFQVTLQNIPLPEISPSTKDKSLTIPANYLHAGINFVAEHKVLSFVVVSAVAALSYAIKLGLSTH